MKATRSVLITLCIVVSVGDARASDPVAQAIKESTQDNSRFSACVNLSRIREKPSSTQASAMRKKAVEAVVQKMKINDPLMLRARADVARKGLYGYPQDQGLALKIYEKASKSAEAGWNAALMLYQHYGNQMPPAIAKRIVETLQKTGASEFNSRGVVGSYAHYVTGILQETGIVGTPDPKNAYLHYRASARNGYVPGAYHYLRLTTQSLAQLPESDRNVAMQEVRMMVNRWKWQSPEIMLLAGNLYASHWLPDEDGFQAQYHWRMAQKMGGATEIRNFEQVVGDLVVRLPAEKEKRMEEAVDAGMRNTMKVKHTLEYADLCSE